MINLKILHKLFHRHSGRDCRNPEHRDVIGCTYVKTAQWWSCMTKNQLIEMHNNLIQTFFLISYCHPWLLDPGNPCRDDALWRYLYIQRIGA